MRSVITGLGYAGGILLMTSYLFAGLALLLVVVVGDKLADMIDRK